MNLTSLEKTTDDQFAIMGNFLGGRATDEELKLLTEEQRGFLRQTVAVRALDGTSINVADFINAVEGKDPETMRKIALLSIDKLRELAELGFDVFQQY